MRQAATQTVQEGVRPEAAAEPRKIIFVNRFFYPDTSATAQILHDLVRHLAGEYRLVVVTGRYKIGGDRSALAPRERVDGVEVHRLWSISQGSGSTFRKLMAFICFYPSAFVALLRIVGKGDLLVTKTDPPLFSVVGVIAARLKGAVLINWLQDLYPEVAIRLGTPLLRGLAGRLLVAIRDWSLRHAHTNVVIGSLMAKKIAQHRVEPRCIRIIPNWADEEVIQPIAAVASVSRRDWNLCEHAFVVGYSGNLGRAHEIKTIGGAAERLRHRKDILFLFVGGGSASAELQRLVTQKGLSNCAFRPYQPQSMLDDSLAAADVHWISLRPELEGLIVPSKFYGVAAAGRPVIAVSHPEGEVASLVRSSGCGHIVQPGDVEGMVAVIEDLASDRDRRQMMGARSRELATGAAARARALGQWSLLVREVLSESCPSPRSGQPNASLMSLGHAAIPLVVSAANQPFLLGG